MSETRIASSEWRMTAFATRTGGGNPAGVVLDPIDLSDDDMVRTAVRLNPLSETAFVRPPDPADGAYPVRYFAPGGEVALCGHATAAAFGALAMDGRLHALPAEVRSRAPGGRVTGRVEKEDRDGVVVWLDMPIPTRVAARLDPQALAAALGLPAASLATEPAVAVEDIGIRVALVPLADLAALDAMRPSFDALRTLGAPHRLTVFYAFVLDPETGSEARARSFAPAVDIDEDPATGTAAASLGAFLARAGLVAPGREIRIRQGEAMGHPSEIRLRVATGDDGAPASIHVGGRVRGGPVPLGSAAGR